MWSQRGNGGVGSSAYPVNYIWMRRWVGADRINSQSVPARCSNTQSDIPEIHLSEPGILKHLRGLNPNIWQLV